MTTITIKNGQPLSQKTFSNYRDCKDLVEADQDHAGQIFCIW